MDDSLLEFTTAYKSVYKDKFKTNCNDYFDELIEKSGIDAEANRQTAKKYREVQAEADSLSNQLGKKKALKAFLIVLTVLLAVAAVVTGFIAFRGNKLIFIGTALALAGVIALIVVIVKVLNPKIKNVSKIQSEKAAKAAELKSECMAQLAPLFALYNNFCTFQLIEKTIPLFKFDRNYNMKRYGYFRGKYGLEYKASNDKSTLDIFSGEINGNPFFMQKELDMTMGTETYHGSLVIHWTVTVRDSNGRYRTVTRSQTLHASVTKPKPFYATATRLIYANDAAPDLSFSHQPQHWEKLSEKEIASKVKSGQKKIQKLAEKSVTKGGGFTEMGNPEFDVLFGATDRDNEVQFRLLFTPLAQKNMLALMKTPDPYGDDFAFSKRKRINYVASQHSQSFDYSVNTSNFVYYDVDVCKTKFISYNEDFFRSLYFDFAPLMSVPLYQQYKPVEYIYGHEFESNNTMYEAEVLANRLDVNLLCHPATKTQTILNAHISKKSGDSDVITIDAYSFDAQQETEFVPVLGGDMRTHMVPVNWINYVPLTNQTLMNMSNIPTEEDDFRDDYGSNSAKRHGLLAKLIK